MPSRTAMRADARRMGRTVSIGRGELRGDAQIEQIRAKRSSLARLLEQPNLGTLRIDVNQALEEMDDLLEEFDRAFGDQS